MRLFDPIALRGLALSNRIVVSPMCQYSADGGAATDCDLVHWGQLLQSGAGMLTIEATAVTPEGRITPGCLGLWDDATEQALGDRLARARRQAPPMPVTIQLGHAGRKASSRRPWEGGALIPPAEGGWLPLAPSPTPTTRRPPRRSTPTASIASSPLSWMPRSARRRLDRRVDRRGLAIAEDRARTRFPWAPPWRDRSRTGAGCRAKPPACSATPGFASAEPGPYCAGRKSFIANDFSGRLADCPGLPVVRR